jgi:hypothetical protein
MALISIKEHVESDGIYYRVSFLCGAICWWWRNRRGVIRESPEIVLEESEKGCWRSLITCRRRWYCFQLSSTLIGIVGIAGMMAALNEPPFGK